MKDQIEVGLRELRASIKRMGELLEWRKLREQEERSDVPPSFQFQDGLEADVKIEEGAFWKSVFEIQDVLGETNNEASEKWRKRLAGLEQEMRELTTKE
ncbi:MAG: hypothetical protein Q8Q12_11410 [bacterium]|nr:hypothetical protein [bacterium]